MSKIQQAFVNGKAFIPFITAGDPSLEITEQLVVKMAEAGVDLIELGLPFSDPVAEGPVIQRADERALAGGVTTDKIFDMMRRIRKACQVPVVFMTYANPIFTYGTERFLKNCQETGVDALIVPDVPFEEKDELLLYCSKHNVYLISVIAPSSYDRIRMIAREAQGFVCCVPCIDVTGVRQENEIDARKMVELVKETQNIPCVIGFDVPSHQQAAQMAQVSDGAIVGSTIMRIVEQYGVDCVQRVVEYVRMTKETVCDLQLDEVV